MTGRCAVCVALTALAGVATARGNAPWDGGYLGFDAGDGSSSACTEWTLTGVAADPANTGPFNSSNCSKKDGLVAGLKGGENFQYKRLVWGIGADLDYWGSKTTNQSFTYAGAVPPPGKYTYANRPSPRGFAIVGPRVGYGGDTWLPYVRVGAILSAGGHDNELFYSAPGSRTTTASFSGGKDFATAGWAAGAGVELGLNGAWSISAEYLRANLGKGSDSTAACAGTAAVCAGFSGLSLDGTHGGFSSNIVRVGVVYYFGYWDI